MKYESSIFPQQKLSSKYKTEDWAKKCVDYVIGMGQNTTYNGNDSYMDEMTENYDLYIGKFDEKKLRYVTDPFNQEDGFPASAHDMNIIKPKIDLLVGEETKKPFKFNVIRTSQDSVSDLQEKMKTMIVDYILATAMSSYSEEEKANYMQMIQNGEIMPPEKIQSFMSNSYKDIAESSAYHSIKYLNEKLGLQNTFNRGFADLLKGSKEIYYLGSYNGDPIVERVDPRYFMYDASPDLEYIEDGDWAARKMIMSATEAYDRYYDKIDEKDLDKLLELCGQSSINKDYGKDAPIFDYLHYDFKTIKGPGDKSFANSSMLEVWHTTWKSYKKVGFIKYMDENGELKEEMVGENYMATGLELDIQWDWVIEIWEGTKLGDDLFIGMAPIEDQYMGMDSPNARKLPYYGGTMNEGKSLVSILKPLQYMYIVIWYRLELALARDKGKILTMDITQIPKSLNIDPAKWLHYLSSLGVNFVNPYDDGWDIPGREGGKASAFNQISADDLSMTNTISQYIEIMNKLEDMVAELSGVTKQRQGSISTSELVGNVERSVQQSSYITEYIFWIHNQVKRNVLRGLLNKAKAVWKRSGKKSLQYILSDATRTFIMLDDSFFYEDMDIFVSDSTKDAQDIEALRSLYQPAMQNGASLLDVAEIMTMDNLNEIKTKLKVLEQQRMEREQEVANQENERQAQLIQLQNQAKSEQLAMEQAKLELEKYKIDSDNQTKIYVAELNAYRGTQEMDQDQNGILDVMEIAQLSLKQNEMESNKFDKESERRMKDLDSMRKADIEKKKIDAQKAIEDKKMSVEKEKMNLEKKKMDMQIQLQKIKDKAAMEREQLKAKTALKNKTAGESKK